MENREMLRKDASVGTVLLFVALVLSGWSSGVEAREPARPTSDNPEAQALLDRAWAALDEELTLPRIDEAIRCLEKALAQDPENPEILVELADEYYQRGEQMPSGSGEDFRARAAYFLKGLETAEKALQIRESAAAHYWVAANLAASCEDRGRLRQAMIFPRLNAHINWIEANDRHYKYGAIARFWSRVVTRIPAVVVRMVGEDPDRIFAALEEAIQSEPRFLDNYVYQAEFLHHMGRREEALEVLGHVLRMDPDAFPEERAYNRYAQEKALRYWKTWSGKEVPER